MKNAPRRFGKKSIRKLLQTGQKRRLARLRRFETLESRLMLHGDNGPHDVDPIYDSAQFFHIHADLAIYIDSDLVALPDDIGIGDPNFTSFVHTHSGDPNRLHLEPAGGQPSDFVTLGDFFDVWRNNAGTVGNNPDSILTDMQLLDRIVDNDNALQAYVNGTRLDDHFADYQIHDGDNIVLTFGNNPVITIETNAGNVPILLLRDEAPATVTNFLRYVNGGVDSNGYLGSIFHRNDNNPRFVLQGGGFRPTSLTTTDIDEIQGSFVGATGDFERHIPTFNPIPDERMAGDRSNSIGTIAMAKNSAGATSEFFYNMSNNAGLDIQGFTVFALGLGATTPTGGTVATAPINQIIELMNVDVDPSNDGTTGFSVFDNVPFTAAGEMVAFLAIQGEGVVRGMKFNDQDGDGVHDANEPGLQGFTIFSDANENQVLDDGEVSAMTDADGNYVLRLAPGSHSIREVPATGFSQTLPQDPDSYSLVVKIGDEIADLDFGNVGVAAPTSVDLVAATDSGTSDSDSRTNFNNSTIATAPQFIVSGVTVGATVEVRVDGVVFASQVATADSITLTLDGATTIADGSHQISAVQSVGGAFGNSVASTIEIDSQGPMFSSTPVTAGVADEPFTYDVDTDDEAGSGASYVIVDSITGEPVAPVTGDPVINPTTGTFAWTPGIHDVGVNNFAVRATDQTGNSSTQSFSVDVAEPVVVQFRLEVTKGGQPLSANNLVKNGDQILLSAFVDDIRVLDNPAQGGVFSAYLDVLYDSSIASVAGSLTFGDVFTEVSGGDTSVPGIIDGAGAFSGRLSPIGQGERLLWTLPLDIIGSGTLTFVGEPTTDPNDPGDAGQSPSLDVAVYDQSPGKDFILPMGPAVGPNFGTMVFVNTTVNVDARFGIIDLPFQPEEDTTDNPIGIVDITNNPLNLNLSFVGTPTAQNGTVTITADMMKLLYTPDPNYTGVDVINFSITDGEDTLNGAQSIFVFNTNDVPIANDDTFVVPEDLMAPFFADVASNDSTGFDPETEKSSFRVISVQTISTQGGTVAIAGVGLGLTYLPPANFTGQDTFTYTISDRDAVNPLTSLATVTVTVEAVNDPPTANDDTFGESPNPILEDSVENVLAVLGNDNSEPDANESISVVAAGFTQPLNGIVTLSASNEVLYTPNPDFFGEDFFTYTIIDDDADDPRTASATVFVNVSSENDNPMANDDAGVRVTQNTSANIDVLGNDSFAPDMDEVLMVISVSADNANATVEIASDGLSIIYMPPTDFLGTDMITYTISDGNGGEDTAIVSIEVVEFMPGSLSGLVFVDQDDDGIVNTDDDGMMADRLLEGVTITLTGTDIFGMVSRTTMTAADGSYEFANLAPGDFVITQTQPAEDLDADGIPLLDGRDTIGSQGGVAGKDAAGNDTFTITLAEGVIGTDNNFGEIKGRTIEVTVGSSMGIMVGGLQVELFEGSELRSATLTSFNGDASFHGLVPGSYRVQVKGPFLLNDESDVILGDQGAVVPVSLGEPAINPVFPTYLDSLSSRSARFATVAVGLSQQHWLALGNGWQDTTNVQVQMVTGGEAIELTIAAADGTFQGTIAKTNGLLNVLNQLADGTSRIRLNGSPAAFKAVLTQVNTNGSGEGESVLLTAGVATSVGSPSQAIPSGVQSPSDSAEPVGTIALDATRTIIGDSSLPPLAVAEGESVSNLKSVDRVFTELVSPGKKTNTRDTLELGEEDPDELLSAVDQSYADLVGGGLVDTLDGPLAS
jgi:cyclophilin family peptidyl-prolyl cis-trans isomerase